MPTTNLLNHLQKALLECLEKLEGNDATLFKVEGSEWSIAHRLAVYLEPMFPGWNVDCEYNRQGERDIKRRDNGAVGRPDISIHRRTLKHKDDNLLVIEMKKKNDGEDMIRACDFTSEPNEYRMFQYQFGVAISFDPSRKLTWFSDGKKAFPA